jgi:hypothetical protein
MWHIPKVCVLRDGEGVELIQDNAHMELVVDGAQGGLIIYHRVMLKVEMDSEKFPLGWWRV